MLRPFPSFQASHSITTKKKGNIPLQQFQILVVLFWSSLTQSTKSHALTYFEFITSFHILRENKPLHKLLANKDFPNK